MSGLIAGVTNNQAYLNEICWGCRIMCLKTAETKTGLTRMDAQLLAYDYIIRKEIYLAYSGYYHYEESNAELAAYQLMSQRGTLVVVPAGNHGCNFDAPVNDPKRCVE